MKKPNPVWNRDCPASLLIEEPLGKIPSTVQSAQQQQICSFRPVYVERQPGFNRSSFEVGAPEHP